MANQHFLFYFILQRASYLVYLIYYIYNGALYLFCHLLLSKTEPIYKITSSARNIHQFKLTQTIVYYFLEISPYKRYRLQLQSSPQIRGTQTLWQSYKYNSPYIS